MRVYAGLLLLVLVPVLLACLQPAVAAAPASLALVHGRLIDGTGAAPIADAMVVVKGGQIAMAGKYDAAAIPKGARLVDLKGATILPGFFNAHVHDGFVADNLSKWAQAGVTTVCDLGMRSVSYTQLLAARDGRLKQPRYARLLSAGPMICVPGGYGALSVASPMDAEAKVNSLIDAGVDLIKISMEDGYAGTAGLPKLSADEIRAIVETAHKRGKQVAVHVTQAKYLKYMLDFEVDGFTHLPYDYMDQAEIERLAARRIWVTPTFSVYKAYGAAGLPLMENLSRLYKAGGRIILGSDFNGGPGAFETGIPFYELEMMQSGMTPMQIIMAGTSAAADAFGVGEEMGRVETGKVADLLVVGGDPLQDLGCLKNVRLVLRGGVIIRD